MPVEINQSIPERFATIRERFPSRLAVKASDGVLTYEQLDRRSNAVASCILNAQGHSGDAGRDAVAIFLPQGAELICAILGVLKAGRAYVPLDEAFPADLRRFILDDSSCSLVLTHTDLEGVIGAEAPGRVQVITVEEAQASAPAVPRVAIGPESLAYIYYTSGTTGRAKGVLDCHRNVLHNVMRYTDNLEIDENDRLTLLQTPGFSGAVSSTFCGILNGGAIFPFDLARQGLSALTRTLRDDELTIYHSVPSVFEALMESGPTLPSLRWVRLEGDASRKRHVDLFRQHFDEHCTLVNGLGATETGISTQFFFKTTDVLEGDLVPIGYPTLGIRAFVLGGDGEEAVVGSVGEIAIESRFLACGYWRQPELTAERFEPGRLDPEARCYRSGDLGRLRADGCLEFLGRCQGFPLDRNGKVDEQALDGLPEATRRPQEHAPSQTTWSTEPLLLELWRSALQQSDVSRAPFGRNESFFDLGGTSLDAIRLARRIEERLDCSIPPSLLFEHPSVAAFAEHLETSPRLSTLVPICHGGAAPALFFVHQEDGDIAGLWSLAEQLGVDQALFGFRALRRHQFMTLEEIAADHINTLRRRFPEGPYHLAGNCQGGLLALEMARQLGAEGSRIGALVLLDTAVPTSWPLLKKLERMMREWHYYSGYPLLERARRFVEQAFRHRRERRQMPPLSRHAPVEAFRRYRATTYSGEAVALLVGREGLVRSLRAIVPRLEVVSLPPLDQDPSDDHLIGPGNLERVAHELLRLLGP